MTQTHASQSEFVNKIKELTDAIQKERSDEESTLESGIDAEENKQQRTRSDNQQSIRLTQKKLQAAQKRTGELGQQWAVKEQANLQSATQLGKKQNEADAEDAKVAADVNIAVYLDPGGLRAWIENPDFGGSVLCCTK